MFKTKTLTGITVLFTSVIMLASCNKDDDLSNNPEPANKKLWKITSGEHDSTLFAYTTTGELHKVITTEEEDQPGPVTYTFTYNPAGKVTEISSTNGITLKYRYEANQLTLSETFHAGKKISENYYQYENNRLGSTTLFSPTAHGNGDVTYKPTFKTTYAYDGSGRVEKFTSYTVNPATLAQTKVAEKQINQYDNAKNPLTMLNSVALATFFEFQSANNINKETSYDEDGNVEETTINSRVYDSNSYPVTNTSVKSPALGVPETTVTKYYYK